jgi:hypothetical protein
VTQLAAAKLLVITVNGLLIAVTFPGITPDNVGDNNDQSSDRAATTAAWNRVIRSQVIEFA